MKLTQLFMVNVLVPQLTWLFFLLTATCTVNNMTKRGFSFETETTTSFSSESKSLLLTRALIQCLKRDVHVQIRIFC